MLSYALEKIREQGGAFRLQHAAVYGGAVAVALLKKVYHAAAGACKLIPRAEHDRRYAGIYYCSGAHRAGLERDEDGAALEPPVADFGAGFADGLKLGVGGGVVPLLAAVAAAADDAPPAVGRPAGCGRESCSSPACGPPGAGP